LLLGIDSVIKGCDHVSLRVCLFFVPRKEFLNKCYFKLINMMKRIRNIRRIDNPARSTYAWLVQVQRRQHIISKMFSDSIYGGKDKALTAALTYRDALILAAAPAEINLWRRTIIRRNNTSGIPGVGLYKTESGAEKWVAYWTDEHGIRRSKNFAVNAHGKRKAKQLAITARKEQLARIFEIKNTDPLVRQ
jgi:hypothetical protein